MTTESAGIVWRVLTRLLRWCVLGPLMVLVALILLAFASTAIRERADRLASRPNGAIFVNVGDSRMLVRRVGPESAPAVIFIGGTGGWSGLWHASLEQAAGAGYQAIGVDLAPFGYSTLPANGDYGKRAQGRRLLLAMDALGLQRVTLVAHSFGAASAMEAVFAAPQRFSGLVLVDPALGLDAPQLDVGDTPVHRWLSKAIVARPITAILSQPFLTKMLVQRVVSEKEKVTEDWVRLYQEPMRLQGASAGIAGWLPEVTAPRRHEASDEINNYRELAVPTHLIWGAADNVTALSQGQHLQSWIHGATLQVIPRAGHVPQIEESEAFARLLGSWLGSPTNLAGN